MKYRVKFGKEGPMMYIGHLDIMRYFQRLIRRSGIPIAYSEGFSPHQILSFAFPLSLGLTSCGEYFDMELKEEVEDDKILKALSDNTNPFIKIYDVKKLPDNAKNCMSVVFASKYEITFTSGISGVDYKSHFFDYFSQDIIAVKKPVKKSGRMIDIDLKRFIYEYGLLDEPEGFYITVNSSSSDNIKPSFVVDCFLSSLNCDKDGISYDIRRIETYENKGTEDEIKLYPLL